MCRLAAYLGSPRPLSTLLYDAAHPLHDQAFAPRRQRHGNVNVDGTGIAWWQPGEDEPLRYVSDRPPWSDVNLPGLAPRLRSHAQIAAVRSATPGIGHGSGCAAPFVHGRLAAAHNGWIGGFRPTLARLLLGRLPDHLYAEAEAASDSLALFLTVVHALEEEPAAGVEGAVRRGVGVVADLCAEQRVPATLTLVVADGEVLVATTTAVATEPNELWVLAGAQTWSGAVLLASEPLDGDPAWLPLPAGHLTVAGPDGVVTRPAPGLEPR